MAKRVYSNSVKKWALGAGIPSGIVGFALIFIYLSAIGVIEVTGYSDSYVCEGTLNNPCIALINFTAKEDIFLYPLNYDPWDRTTPFQTDKDIESWKMYRSWGSSWREIDLYKRCTSTWCGAPPNSPNNLYSFAFRKDRDYQIKIEAVKKSPYDTIKWSFTKYVDPFFYGIDSPDIEATKITMELGSQINITTNLTDYSGGVCVDIDHPDYGNNYACGTPSANFLFNISYFRKDELNDSSTQKDLTYSGSNDIGIEREGWNSSVCAVDCGRGFDEDFTTYAKTKDASPYYTYIYENFTIPSWFDISEGDTATWYFRSGWETGESPTYIGCDTSGASTYSNFYSTGCQGCATTRAIPSTCLDNGNTLTMRTRIVKSGGGTTPWSWYYDGNVTFQDFGNQTVYIKGHQYDEVEGLVINLTGHSNLGSYPTNVKIYVNNTLSNDVGLLFDGQITETLLNDNSATKNRTYTTSQTLTEYLRIPKTAEVSSALLSLSGYKAKDSSLIIEDDTEDASCDIQCTYINVCNGTDYTGCYYSGGNGCSLSDTSKCIDEDLDTYCYIQASQTVSCIVNAWHYENFTVPTPVENIEEATVTVKYDLKGFDDRHISGIDIECNEGSGFSEGGYNIFVHRAVDSGITTVTRDVPSACITNAKSTGVLEFEYRLLKATGSTDVWTYVRFYDASVTWINNSYPDNLSLEVGISDGIHEWNFTGEFNSTHSPNRTTNFSSSLNSFLSVCVSDDDGYCAIPLYFVSQTAGKIEISDIEINYTNDPNPITLSADLVSSFLGNSTNFADIPIKFESSQAGIINISDIRFDYVGGNDTTDVLVYSHLNDVFKTSFNNSLLKENLTFTQKEDFVRILNFSKYSTINSAVLNLTGYSIDIFPGWDKKQEIKVQENSGNSFANYTTKIDVPYDSDMQADFDDLRFMNSFQSASLPYWIENYTSGTSACVWVMVPDLVSNENTTIYMYYGNSSVETTSSKNGTFLFVDEFNNSLESSKWQTNIQCSGGSIYSSEGRVYLQNNEITGCNVVMATVMNFTSPVVATFNFKFVALGSPSSRSLFGLTNSIDDTDYTLYGKRAITHYWGDWSNILSEGGIEPIDNPITITPKLEHTLDLDYSEKIIFKAVNNRTFIRNDTFRMVSTHSNSTIYKFFMGIQSGSSTLINISIDDFRVRAYADTEPTISFGDEETGTQFPSNVSMSSDVQIFYQEGYLTTTNQTEDFASILNTNINSGLCDCVGCNLVGAMCFINITFHSDTIGILKYSDINISYDIEDKSNNETLSIINYFSKWAYNLPRYVNYLEFIPKNPTAKNVTPYGQISLIPIFNITTMNYGGKNMNLSIYLNESMPCVNLTYSTDSAKSNGTLLTNQTWQYFNTNLEYNNVSSLYLWADYECSYTNWYLFYPEIYISGCASDVDVCDRRFD